MKAKKFVRRVRSLLVNFTRPDANLPAEAKDSTMLQYLEALLREHAKLADDRMVYPVCIKGDEKAIDKQCLELRLPKGAGYHLVANVLDGGATDMFWDLYQKKGRSKPVAIGRIWLDIANFGKPGAFGYNHNASDTSYDCIDTLQDAVDILISTHTEYCNQCGPEVKDACYRCTAYSKRGIDRYRCKVAGSCPAMEPGFKRVS